MEYRADQRSRCGEDPLAYSDYPDSPREEQIEGDDFNGAAEGERGLVGDTYRKLRKKYPAQQDGSSQTNPSGSGLGSFFDKIHGVVQTVAQDVGSELGKKFGQSSPFPNIKHGHTHSGVQCDDGMHDDTQHRYGSFASQRTGNDAKWFVDGCGYMWAVSRALEQATESIWILDCEHCKVYY